MPVAAGDYFEVLAASDGADTAIGFNTFSYFKMTVTETNDNAFPPEPFEFFVSDALFDGALPTTGLIYKKTVARVRSTTASSAAKRCAPFVPGTGGTANWSTRYLPAVAGATPKPAISTATASAGCGA